MTGNRFRNVRIFQSRLNGKSRMVADEVQRALNRGGLAIAGRAIEGIISPPASGRIYPSRGRKGASHQASAPGEFPNADTGELHQSITSIPVPGRVAVEVQATAPHALPLEVGTSKMRPRPFMGRSFDENVESIETDVRAAIRRGNRRG